jgi:undecaprenyl diphosphate synthase
MEQTSANTGTTLVLALSYSAKWEITEAVKQIALDVSNRKLNPADIDEAIVSTHLMTRDIPDPDLLVRTGGEKRISNFLLWQLSYSELYFTDTFWPDFREEELYGAILYYQQRERRFGKTSEQLNL